MWYLSGLQLPICRQFECWQHQRLYRGDLMILQVSYRGQLENENSKETTRSWKTRKNSNGSDHLPSDPEEMPSKMLLSPGNVEIVRPPHCGKTIFSFRRCSSSVTVFLHFLLFFFTCQLLNTIFLFLTSPNEFLLHPRKVSIFIISRFSETFGFITSPFSPRLSCLFYKSVTNDGTERFIHGAELEKKVRQVLGKFGENPSPGREKPDGSFFFIGLTRGGQIRPGTARQLRLHSRSIILFLINERRQKKIIIKD